MAIDSRGVEYDPFLPSVGCSDGSVFQVLVVVDGEQTVDMAASAALADEYDSQK